MPIPLTALGLAALALLGVAMTGSSRLSRHFMLSEFTRSGTASQRGLDNTPTASAKASLARLASEVLDPLRDAIGQPLRVSSGYRSAEVNRAVGGVPGSKHQQGRAADVYAEGIPAAELMRLAVELDLPFDVAMIYEAKGHLHLDQRPGTAAQQRRLLFYQPATGKAEQLTAPPRRDSVS